MTLDLYSHATSERLVPGPAFAWTLDPLVIDGVFQALIVWCRAHLGAPSLPSRVASVRIFRSLANVARVRAVVRIHAVEGMVVSSHVDLSDLEGTLLVRLEGVLCTASASLHRAFAVEPAAGSTLPVA